MTLGLSPSLLRQMGFRLLEPGKSIEASFVRIVVYEIQGIALPLGKPQISAGSFGNVNFRLAAGTKLNETSFAIVGEVYHEDENAWVKDKKAVGPFLMISLEPIPLPIHTMNEGYFLTEKDGSLKTHDAFSNLRADLAKIEAQVLPSIITSFICNLAELGEMLILRKLDTVNVGRTTDGKILHDIYFCGALRGYVSRPLSSEAISEGLDKVASLAPSFDETASRLFALGIAEEDEQKKFMRFFSAIERQANAAFLRTNLKQPPYTIVSTFPPSNSTLKMLQKPSIDIRAILDRFAWCSACAWAEVNNEDIDQFRYFKNVRDKIAHGSILTPPDGAAREIQLLAQKVLRQ